MKSNLNLQTTKKNSSAISTLMNTIKRQLKNTENDGCVNLDSLTVDELKRLITSNLEDKKKEYNELLASYKTMREEMDGWYYMGYIEDEYEILKPYAEKVGMLKEFETVYNKFWLLEHMTYEDVQKLHNNAKGRQ